MWLLAGAAGRRHGPIATGSGLPATVRNIDIEAVPDGRTVLRFLFTEIPPPTRSWWIVVNDDNVDVCDVDPGFDVLATIHTTLRTMTLVWRGDLDWTTVTRSGDLRVDRPA